MTTFALKRDASGVGLLSLMLVVGCSPAAPEPEKKPISYLVGPNAGRWHAVPTNRDDPNLTDEQRAEIAELEALGYVDGKYDAPDLRGVTRHDAAQVSPGVNLYTSAHAASARLIDMQGELLHEWRYPFQDVWPDYPKGNKLQTFWRRTHLYENGDLLAIYEGLGIIKLDKDSNLLWASEVRAHHDLEVMADGTIYVLTRQAHMIPRISTERPVLEDFISLLEPDGTERMRVSLLEAMEASEVEVDWNERARHGGDLFHTNSLERLDGSLADANPAFAQGNFLVSMLLLDFVAVIDPKAERIVWGKVGPYKAQHDPQVLENGRVMIFDNKGGGGPGGAGSRLLELGPATWETTWSYDGNAREPFYSETCGLAQRLPNGNTLVTETDLGRAFEITREGEIVWEFYNPHRAGDAEQYIATLMEVVRLQDDFPLDWLEQ